MRTFLLAAAAALVMWSGPVHAQEAPQAATAGNDAPQAPASARPKPERLSTVNMPPGWQWPPSPAMRASGDRCLSALAGAGVAYLPARPRGRIATPIVVPDMRFRGLAVRQVFARRLPVMDCHMALALAERAGPLLEAGVRELVVAGFYQPRRARLRGRSLNVLSRHALGLAVDIRAFVMQDGRVLSVARDHADPLLERIEQALSRGGGLRAVVTRRHDPAHRNHFHVSAKMTIDDAHPDASVDVASLLAQVRKPRRGAARAGGAVGRLPGGRR